MSLNVNHTAWVVRPKGAPLFSERAYKVELEDESAGVFIRLSSMADGKGVDIDIGDWHALRGAIDHAVTCGRSIQDEMDAAEAAGKEAEDAELEIGQ